MLMVTPDLATCPAIPAAPLKKLKHIKNLNVYSVLNFFNAFKLNFGVVTLKKKKKNRQKYLKVRMSFLWLINISFICVL